MSAGDVGARLARAVLPWAGLAFAAGSRADDIRDIRGPKPIPSPWLVPALVAGVLAAALLGYAVWRWVGRRRVPRPTPPIDIALARLEAARALMQPGRCREFSIEVSAAVRDYIESVFNVMAAHRTTHEFLHDLLTSADPALAGHRELLGEFLQSCDLAKFGGWNLTADQMGAMLESARRFIRSASAATAQAAASDPGIAPVAADARSTASKSRVSLPST